MKISGAPWPLLQIAIEPKKKADEEKLRIALSRLADEDQDLRVTRDEESGQTIIYGRDEHHLDVIAYRLLQEIALNFGAPQMAYRETITYAREQDYTHNKQFAGQRQFARVKILFEPNGHDPDFVFTSRVPDGAVPDEYVAGVETGLRTMLRSGPFAGFPIIGMKATLVDGAYHQTDSSASAFEIASRACFKEAAPRLGVQQLEPIMKVEVVTPQDYARDIVGDLKGRRRKIENQETSSMGVIVNATVPLANMFKLEDALRSYSKGQARVSVNYAGYAPVPPATRDLPPPVGAYV